MVVSSSGVTREVPVTNGRFNITSLPIGVYTVSLRLNGETIESRDNVSIQVGAGTTVAFAGRATAADATDLSAVTVSANALPPIDASNVNSQTVVTSQQLARLPLQRSAEAIAQLAPGVNQGSTYFKSATGQVLTTFGGSSVAENAYYVNGFNTTNPLNGYGGLTLPYGAIEQQQVLTGGYGAQFGRSDGGVINQIGKRGSNQWSFGARLLWQPDWANGTPANGYYPVGPQYLADAEGGAQGHLYQYNRANQESVFTQNFYLGGPLIKNKLYVFGAFEGERVYEGRKVGTIDAGTATTYRYDNPKWYAKLDWNINESNILELTGASNKSLYSGNIYAFDYAADGSDSGSYGAFKSPATYTKNGGDMWVAKYTGYLTDSLTVEALYGEMSLRNYTRATSSNEAFIQNPGFQNLAYNGAPVVGPQTVLSIQSPDAANKTSNLRLNVGYTIGDHAITVGIDNQKAQSLDQGEIRSGPGYDWVYGKGDPNLPISTQTGQEVGAPGGQGYYVAKDIRTTVAKSVTVKQRAQYIEDRWQVNDRLLLSLGLRNDQFTNFNADAEPYLRLTKPQWAPRIGVSWDVHGDSSLKVYANAGRYYLAEVNLVALRGAGASTITSQYFTYSGIDPATGAPTGLTQIPQGRYPAVSANQEFGVLPDPKVVTSRNAKAEYQDEYIAGMDKAFSMFGDQWVMGAKGMYRDMQNVLDDVCDEDVFGEYGAAQGFDPDASKGANGCFIMNPGRDSTFNVPLADGGYGIMSIPWSAFGMPDLKRKYLSLDLYLEHPFDGKWYGRVDYTLSHGFGNTEGLVRSDYGSALVGLNFDWDNRGTMTYSGGNQSNDRRHQIKLVGYYQINPEWLVGGVVQILSGTPKACLGYFGPEQTDPFGYGGGYHFCGVEGTPAPGGSMGRTPWQELVSLNLKYQPAWADQRLGFSMMVYNVFNQQRTTQYLARSESGPGTLSKNFGAPVSIQQPRYVQFGVSYDF